MNHDGSLYTEIKTRKIIEISIWEKTMKKITNNPSKAKNLAKKGKYDSKNIYKSGNKNNKNNPVLAKAASDKGKPEEKKKQAASKPKEGSFLYLLPEDISAKKLHDALGFLNAKQLEVWTELNLLEVTADEGTITFEDMRESLNEEDVRMLDGLGFKKVYAADYYLGDKSLLHKIMETFISDFGGKIGSDTEDFRPFMEIKEI